MNAKIRWISEIAFLLMFMQSAEILQGQVLIDPRGEDEATRDSEESSMAEITATESRASETSANEPRTLPPPQGPDDQVPVRRAPPPRPTAALPAEPANPPAAEQPRPTGRPYLGITFDPTARDSAVVGAIVPDSPAEQAGLQPGDVVEAMNGQPVGSIEDAFAVVARLRPGEIIDIDFSRRVSARAQAMLEAAPDDAMADSEVNTLPERRSTSYREPARTADEEPIPGRLDNGQDRIRILRRYGDNQTQSNSYYDERREMDRRELEEWLREREREPQRPFRNRPLLRWRRG